MIEYYKIRYILFLLLFNRFIFMIFSLCFLNTHHLTYKQEPLWKTNHTTLERHLYFSDPDKYKKISRNIMLMISRGMQAKSRKREGEKGILRFSTASFYQCSRIRYILFFSIDTFIRFMIRFSLQLIA